MAATHIALGHAFSVRAPEHLDPLVRAALDPLRAENHAEGATHVVSSGAELDQLLTDLNAAAIRSRPEALRLHAGVVARGDHAVLVVGGSGAGKTTFTVAAIEAGWDYLSDEVACVDADALTVEAYPKPLTLKPGTQALLPHLVPHENGVRPESSGGNWQVSPDAVRPGAALASGTSRVVAGIVLVRFDAECELVVDTPSRGQIVLELAQQTAYLGDLDQPLDVLIELADRVPVRRVVHRDARQAVSVLDTLVP